ncbi:MAG: hypothetical protein K5901_04215 [Bacteroidales bacterium]|nr:hypothetical protein [Bacteroidales bacterium]
MFDTGRGAKPWATGTAIMYDTGRGAKTWASGTAIMYDTGSKAEPWASGTAIVHDTGHAAGLRLKKNEKNFNSETTKKYIFADWLN